MGVDDLDCKLYGEGDGVYICSGVFSGEFVYYVQVSWLGKVFRVGHFRLRSQFWDFRIVRVEGFVE